MEKYRKVLSWLAWLGIIGFIIQHLVEVSFHNPVRETIHVLSYYTIQSNIIAAVWLMFAKRFKPCVKTGVLFFITPTLVIYWIMLHQVWQPKGLTLLLSLIAHTIIPVGLWFDWLVDKHRVRITFKQMCSWLIYPLIYFIYSTIYQLITYRYFYPFLNIRSLGIIYTIRNVVLLLAVLFVLASAIRQINNVLNFKETID